MKHIVIPTLLLCALLSSCGAKDTTARKTIIAMDAAATLSINGENADDAISAAEKEFYRLDALLSRSAKTSDIYRLNENGSAAVSSDTAAVIETALGISRETDGAFDITVTPLTDAWGFFNQNYRVPSDSEIQSILPRVGYENAALNGNTASLTNGALVDLGGIAKGYACESAARILKSRGITSALISFGSSSIKAIGFKSAGEPWKIGLADPQNSQEYFMTLEISDTCVATSGSYERFFEKDGKKYHHIINPKTGYPADNGLLSVSVVCADGTRADALSTALFVMGADKAVEFQKKHGGFEAILITDDKTAYVTSGLKDSISAVPDGWTCIIV